MHKKNRGNFKRWVRLTLSGCFGIFCEVVPLMAPCPLFGYPFGEAAMKSAGVLVPFN